MLLVVGICLDPYSWVALDIFFQRNPEPIHALGEVRWVRGGKGKQEQVVGVEFIVMQAQERARLIEEIYASQ
jgi:PilZ domain